MPLGSDHPQQHLAERQNGKKDKKTKNQNGKKSKGQNVKMFKGQIWVQDVLLEVAVSYLRLK